MPIDPSKVVWDTPARPTIDPSKVVWDDAPKAPASAEASDRWHGLGNELLGLGETGLALGTGAVRGLQGGIGTLGGLVVGDSPSEAAQYGQKVMASGYQPRTESGQQNMRALGNLFSLPGEGISQLLSGAVRNYGTLTGQDTSQSAERVGELGQPLGQMALTVAGAKPAMIGAELAGRGVASAGRAVIPKNAPVMIERFLPGGAGRVAGRIQRDIAGTPEMRSKLVEALRNAQEIVKGSKPTAGEVVSGMPEGSPIVASQTRIAAQTGERAGAPSTLFGRRWQEQKDAIRAAELERDSVTAPMRKAALDSAGDVSVKPINNGIAQMRATPGDRTNTVLQKTLRDVQEQIASVTDDSGRINAHDLYGVRKDIGLTIENFVKDNTKWNKKRTASLEKQIQSVIDDSIEQSGGTGWRDYLNEYATRSKAIDADIARRDAMSEQLQPSTLGKQETESAITASTMFNPLERNVMLANALLRAAGKRVAPKVVAAMAEQYLSPQLLAQALERGVTVPPLVPQAAPLAAASGVAAVAQGARGAPPRPSSAPARTVDMKNATDTTGISQEAVNVMAADKAAGRRTVRVRADDSIEPLPGVASRDPSTVQGEPVFSISANGDVQIINRGGMSETMLQGLINRLRAHGKLR